MQTGNKLNKILFLITSVIATGMHSLPAVAQVSLFDSEKRGSIYGGIGSNSATHRPSTIEFTQGTPGNISNYTLDKVSGDAASTSKASGLSNNIRIGYYFDYYQNYAIELAYDPVKYHVTDGQMVRLKGKMDNAAIDTSFAFSAANGYFYNIDGANLLPVNLVRRFQLYWIKSHNLRFDALAKAGGGPTMPHVYNSVKGKVSEYPQFQLGGWNAGLEAAVRVTIIKHIYVEAGYRYTHASYTDIGVYNGSATQKLNTSQIVFTAGVAFATTKRNPLFVKAEDTRWKMSIKPIYAQPIGADGGEEPEPEAKEAPASPSDPAPAPEEPSPAPPTPDEPK